MYSINTLNNNFDDQNDQNRPISSINSSVLRSSLSDSDLITSVAVAASNNNESNHENIVQPATKSLSRDFELLIIDENLAVNNDDSKSADQSNDNKTSKKQSRKSRKSMFLLKRKRRKWISTQIGFITKCFMTRTDSIIDLQTTIDSQNNRLQSQSQPQLSSDGCQSTATNSSDHEDQQQQQPSADSNSNDENIADGDAHRINIDDDLSFMDNFPPLNQPLSRIVSLRRRHPNTPMSRSPEPALLAPNPYPVVLTGFANTYLNHPQIPINDSQSNQQHQQQDHNIPSISSVVVNADPNSGTSTPSGHHNHHPDNESNDDHQRSPQQQQQQRQTYESYSLQMPIINHISIDHPMNRSTSSSSTLTFHTQIDYINCLVPDLLAITNRSFYWGKMDRYKAERLLDGKPEGTFLLRDSAQEDHLFSVSFRRFERSLHARIENWEHRFSFDSHDPGVFSSPTVTGLIEHYKVPSHCMFFEPVLTKPLNRTFTFSLQHLARATICDRVTYDSINRLPLPQILKSYLKEYHYRIKVRTRHFDESSLCRWLESNYHRNNHVSIFDNDESI